MATTYRPAVEETRLGSSAATLGIISALKTAFVCISETMLVTRFLIEVAV